MGQVHPPGHPALVQVLKAVLLLPVGDAQFRGNLFSAIFGAVAASLTALVAGRLSASLGAPRWAVEAAAVAGGVAFATSASSAIQSLSLEVYTLSATCTLGALAIALERPATPKAAPLLAGVVGLGLANHHLLTVLAIPAVLVAWTDRRCLNALLLGGVIAAIVTAGCYTLFFARSLAGATPLWVDATNPGDLLWLASARMFAQSLGGMEEGWFSANVVKAISLLVLDLSPAALALAAWACIASLRHRAWRSCAAVAIFVLGSLASKVMMGILDLDNPDDHGYFLGAVAGTAALAASGGAAMLPLATRLPKVLNTAVTTLAVASLCAIAALPSVTGGAVLRERSGDADTPALARLVLEDQPPRTVLFLAHYPVFFLAMERAIVEGSRPDVTVVQSGLSARALGGRAYAAAVARADGDLAPVVQAFVSTGLLDWDEVTRLARVRPVRTEADMTPPPPAVHLAGWTWAVLPDDTKDLGPAFQQAMTHLAALRLAVPTWPHPTTETRRVLLRNLTASAAWLALQGETKAALALLHAAAELAPADKMVRRMLDAVSSGHVSPSW